MSLVENLRLALEGLRVNKMRAVLTMLGIIIGTAAVIGILTVGDGLSGSITGTMSSFGASTVSVSLQAKESHFDDMYAMMGLLTPDEDDLITEEMIDELRRRLSDEIKYVSFTESIGSGQIKEGHLYANVSVTGVNEEYFAANEVDLLAGRFLQRKDVDGERSTCLVSDKLVKRLFGSGMEEALGRELSVDLGGERLRFRIVGIYEYEESLMNMSMAAEEDISTALYIPVSTAKHLSGAADGYSAITVIAADDADSTVVAAEVESFLSRYYRTNEKYTIFAMSMDSVIESVNMVMDRLAIAIAVIAAISLLVGGIGVMNIMLVSVTERTREIGTRKALGATNGNIRIQFVVESMIICLVGGIIGIILGAILGYVGSSLLEAPAFPTLGSIVLAVGFSLAVGVFFGYYPANKAACMDPIEALRYE